MNSYWNDAFAANRTLFVSRFPELASILGLDSDERTALLVDAIPPSYRLEPSRSPSPTLCVGGTYVYSRHDPLRDAARALEDSSVFTPEGCLFSGCGLAYHPELYGQKFPDSTIILAEPDIFLFILCLASRPLGPFLSHPGLIIIIGTTPGEIIALTEKIGLTDIPVYEAPALTAPNKAWFADFAALRKRNREKREINANTLRRFGDLWLKNMCKNLAPMRDLDGIGRFAGIFTDIPVLILAAGPSLDRILPQLPVLRNYCLIIAVDTAVRACLRSGVEPDFIILVDPQYWNFRHLDGLKSPSSILITESAAWPPVFRFECRAVHLCSSLFPLGKFLESRTSEKGELGAGGSVSTTAWDFARHLGAGRIFMAGLDLGYPGKKTHFTGSIFEERTHASSGRLAPAETEGYRALYGAGPYPVPNYMNGTVLTDKRLILYAWWFESRLASWKAHKTATLTPEGVRIPGFMVASVEDITGGTKVRHEIDTRVGTAVRPETANTAILDERKALFERALGELKKELSTIAGLAREGIQLSCKGLSKGKTGDYARIIARLNQIDAEILASTAKEITSMVFPGKREITAEETVYSASANLYQDIFSAAEKNIMYLEKFY